MSPRAFSAPANNAPEPATLVEPRALPPPPTVPAGFELSKRGFVEGDPLPDRPPEGTLPMPRARVLFAVQSPDSLAEILADDLAISTRYFDSIVILYMLSKESAFVVERAVRLVDPRCVGKSGLPAMPPIYPLRPV